MVNEGPAVLPAGNKSNSGCRTALIIVAIVVVVCGALGGGVAWYVWQNVYQAATTEECFPAGTDGPLDTSHGKVSCAHPNAIWKITKELDGQHEGDIIATCGPEGDALIYLPEDNKSYCLDYVN